MELESFWSFVRTARRDAAQRATASAARRSVRDALRELQLRLDALPVPKLPDGSVDAVALFVDAEAVPGERPQGNAGVWLQRLRDERPTAPDAAANFMQAVRLARPGRPRLMGLRNALQDVLSRFPRLRTETRTRSPRGRPASELIVID